MRDKQEIFADLAKPLPGDLVATRSDRGQKLSYIEGFDAINQANKVFGFDGWGTEVIDIAYREMERNGNPIGFYQARIRITVEGFQPKMDIGVGLTAGFSPDAHETAIKAAVTDGIKRTLRQFGNQFGNSLYDKENPLGEEQPPAAPKASGRPAPPTKVDAETGEITADTPPVVLATVAQLKALNAEAARVGMNLEQLLEWVATNFNVANPRELTAQQAMDAITRLTWMPASEETHAVDSIGHWEK